MLYRGTTPTHTFKLPFSTDDIQTVIAGYFQNGSLLLRKEDADFLREGDMLKVKLTQKETLLFDCKYPFLVQLKVKTIYDDVLVSDPISSDVRDCLIEGEL